MNNLITMGDSSLKRAMRIAEIMATSNVTVPKHLQGNQGDCMAICLQAMQWGINPFSCAQQTFLVNGTLGYSAQLVNSVVASSTAIKGRFKYEYRWEEGSPNGYVRAGAVIKGEEAITWGEWLNTATVTTKISPLWRTNPKQQASYLAVKMWVRLYTPDVLLGVYTPDELQQPAQQPVHQEIQSPTTEPAPKALQRQTINLADLTNEALEIPEPEPVEVDDPRKLKQVEKRKAVYDFESLLDKGVSAVAAAEQLGVARTTILGWQKAMNEEESEKQEQV